MTFYITNFDLFCNALPESFYTSVQRSKSFQAGSVSPFSSKAVYLTDTMFLH